MAKSKNEFDDDTPGLVPTGKGRPTPKRKDREAAQRRPLVASGKEASKRRRAERQAQLAKEQHALQTGEERYMPRAHAGGPRRFARDFIDARTTISEFILFAAILAFLVMTFLTPYPAVANGVATGSHAVHGRVGR